MFGKQSKKQEQSYQAPPVRDGISEAFSQQMNQQVQQTTPLQFPSQPIYQPQVQVPQVPVKQALIIKAELTEKGEYYYVVITDYPVNLGNCILENR